MGERIIFCCGASGWTRLIGWVMSVLHLTWTLILVTCLFLLPWSDVLELAETIASYLYGANFRNTEDERWKKRFVTQCFILVLISVSLGGLSSVLMLVGSYKKKAKLMLPWILYTMFSSIIGVFLEIYASIFSAKDSILLTILTIAGNLGLSSFCIWAVASHLMEIDSSKNKASKELYKA